MNFDTNKIDMERLRNELIDYFNSERKFKEAIMVQSVSDVKVAQMALKEGFDLTTYKYPTR